MQLKVNSSMITELQYSMNRNLLEVTFAKGNKYQYSNVPNVLLMQMLDCDNNSIGKFFHFHILRHPELYPFQKL